MLGRRERQRQVRAAAGGGGDRKTLMISAFHIRRQHPTIRHLPRQRGFPGAIGHLESRTFGSQRAVVSADTENIGVFVNVHVTPNVVFVTALLIRASR